MMRFGRWAFLLALGALGLLGCGVFGGSAPEGPLRLAPDDTRELILINTSEAALSRTPLPGEFEAGIASLRDYGDIGRQAWLRLASGRVIVSEGAFDYEGIREVLSESGHRGAEHRGFELWESGDGVTARAMLEDAGYFISGDAAAVRDVLRAVDRGQGLLWDDGRGAIRRALDGTEEGLLTTASADCRVAAAGCEAAAWVFARGESRRTILGTGRLRFRDEELAAAGTAAVEQGVGANGATELVEVAADGEVVTVRVEIERDAFGGLEFPLGLGG